jgi:hypothetical protein
MFSRFRALIIAILASFGIYVGSNIMAVDANLTAVMPTKNVSGSTLTDLAKANFYKVNIPSGACPTGLAAYTFMVFKPVTVAGATVTAVDSNIANGRNCYVVTAVDASGNESAPSAPAFKDVDLDAPTAPTLTVN